MRRRALLARSPIPVLALVVVAVVAGGHPRAAAQEASPGASPAAGTCVAPELPPGTPTPFEAEGTPSVADASPMAGMAMGTPEAVEEAEDVAETAEAEATPAATPAPVGTPADAATAQRIADGIQNVVDCHNAGDYEAEAALVTEGALLQDYGTTNPYDQVAESEAFPVAYELRSVENVQAYADGRLSADIALLVNGHWLFGLRQFVVEEGGYVKLDVDEEIPVDPPAGSAVVRAEMVDYAFELSQSSAPAGAPLVFEAPNRGQYPHELVVVRLPEGATAEGVLSGEVAEADVQFVGATFAEPGGTARLVLVDLEPGTYTLVCFVDVPEGVPHVARGMHAQFAVE